MVAVAVCVGKVCSRVPPYLKIAVHASKYLSFNLHWSVAAPTVGVLCFFAAALLSDVRDPGFLYIASFVRSQISCPGLSLKLLMTWLF